MTRKMLSLLAAVAMLMSLVTVMPVSASVPCGFGDLADFEDAALTPDVQMTTGWIGAELLNPEEDDDPSRSLQMSIVNSVVTHEEGAGAEGDDDYLQFTTAYGDSSGLADNSRVIVRSQVVPGNNYVVTFWTKTKDIRTLAITVDYEIFQGNTLRAWTTDTLHNSDGCYQTFNENSRLYMNSRLNASPGAVPVASNGTDASGSAVWVEHEGLWNNMMGYTAVDEGWVKNELEFHIPHCADVLKLTIMANGRNTNAFKGAVDNISIRQVESNIICNGGFDYESYFSSNRVNSGDTYAERLTPSNWQTKVGQSANAGATFIRTNDNGNNYYIADSVTYSGVANGMQMDQYVTLHPGTYKLSFKRIYFNARSDGDPEWGFVSMRHPKIYVDPTKSYANEPHDDDNSFGASGVYFAPIVGCSLMPHAVQVKDADGSLRNQEPSDGWVNHEVYFEVTEAGRFTLSFGSKRADAGKWAIDDVVLLPVEDDMALSFVKDAEVVSRDVPYTYRDGIGEANNVLASGTGYICDVIATPVEDVNSDGAVKSVLIAKKGVEKTGDIITALYEDRGNGMNILREVKASAFALNGENIGVVAAEEGLTVPTGGDFVVKSFVWDSLTGLKGMLKATIE